MQKIIIIGAGITGLTTAYWLKQKNFDVTILERNSSVGGNIQTLSNNGNLFDSGPNSGLETTPLISKLVKELNLQDQFCYANNEGNKRYILREGKLQPLPMNPKSFIQSKLFSTKGKLRLLLEPFISKSDDGYYQSVSQFVRRRLGKEFLDYAINPFVSGVFAGDPEQLSIKSAFPKLYRLEEVYGGLFKGMLKGAKERKVRAEQSKQAAKMFSFKDGMKILPDALSSYLNERIMLNINVEKLIPSDTGFELFCHRNNEKFHLKADSVILTSPAYETAKILAGLDRNLYNHLNSIYYPPVIVLNIVYPQKAVGQRLDGFGFLIPEKEGKNFLGAIWNSVIFPNRAIENEASFTMFIGGARYPRLLELNIEKVIDKVISEFQSIMRINGRPLFIKYKIWEKAIPQYNIGYIEHEKYFEEFEKQFPGIFLGGNYRGGISMGDCIKNSELLANKIVK